MSRLAIIAARVAIAFAALSLPLAAGAQDIVSSPTEAPAVATVSLSTDVTTSPFGDSAIADDSLQSVAGREDVAQAATATQTAGVSRNSIGDNSRTGDARISDNAFQNLSGLSLLNVNTGNNVAINAAMNVNISINPGQ